MKAKAKLIVNSQELIDAEKMGLDKIKPQFDWFDVYFDPRAIYLTFITTDGNISVHFMNQILSLKHNEELWNKIRTQLEFK